MPKPEIRVQIYGPYGLGRDLLRLDVRFTSLDFQLSPDGYWTGDATLVSSEDEMTIDSSTKVQTGDEVDVVDTAGTLWWRGIIRRIKQDSRAKMWHLSIQGMTDYLFVLPVDKNLTETTDTDLGTLWDNVATATRMTEPRVDFAKTGTVGYNYQDANFIGRNVGDVWNYIRNRSRNTAVLQCSTGTISAEKWTVAARSTDVRMMVTSDEILEEVEDATRVANRILYRYDPSTFLTSRMGSRSFDGIGIDSGSSPWETVINTTSGTITAKIVDSFSGTQRDRSSPGGLVGFDMVEVKAVNWVGNFTLRQRQQASVQLKPSTTVTAAYRYLSDDNATLRLDLVTNAQTITGTSGGTGTNLSWVAHSQTMTTGASDTSGRLQVYYSEGSSATKTIYLDAFQFQNDLAGYSADESVHVGSAIADDQVFIHDAHATAIGVYRTTFRDTSSGIARLRHSINTVAASMDDKTAYVWHPGIASTAVTVDTNAPAYIDLTTDPAGAILNGMTRVKDQAGGTYTNLTADEANSELRHGVRYITPSMPELATTGELHAHSEGTFKAFAEAQTGVRFLRSGDDMEMLAPDGTVRVLGRSDLGDMAIRTIKYHFGSGGDFMEVVAGTEEVRLVQSFGNLKSEMKAANYLNNR